MEARRFVGALQRILRQSLTADLLLGPLHLSKVDLADSYMRLWVRMEVFPSVAFLFPKKTHINSHLVGFCLFLPMEYVDSAPHFCMATETVADLVNKAIAQQDVASTHPLEQAAKVQAVDDAGAPEDQADASWEQLSVEQFSTATVNVDI